MGPPFRHPGREHSSWVTALLKASPGGISIAVESEAAPLRDLDEPMITRSLPQLTSKGVAPATGSRLWRRAIGTSRDRCRRASAPSPYRSRTVRRPRRAPSRTGPAGGCGDRCRHGCAPGRPRRCASSSVGEIRRLRAGLRRACAVVHAAFVQRAGGSRSGALSTRRSPAGIGPRDAREFASSVTRGPCARSATSRTRSMTT